MDFLGGLLGLGGSFLQGLFGSRQRDKEIAAAQNLQAQQNAFAQNMLLHQEGTARQQWARENQAAITAANVAHVRSRQADALKRSQEAKRVRTLVADAKAAGIHPLAALGATGLSSPTAMPVGGAGTPTASMPSAGSPGMVSLPQGGNPWGDAIASGVNTLLQLRQQEMDYQLRREEVALARSERRQRNVGTIAMLADATSRSRIAGARAAGAGGTAGGVKGGLNIGDVIASVTGAPQGDVPVIGVRKPGDWTDFFGDDSWDNVIGPIQLINTVLDQQAKVLAGGLARSKAKWDRKLIDVLTGESRAQFRARRRNRPSPRGRQPRV